MLTLNCLSQSQLKQLTSNFIGRRKPLLSRIASNSCSILSFRKFEHGGSFKQAYLERYVQNLLESFKASENSTEEIVKELQACRYDVFSLVITELYSHLPMDLVFNNLQNLMSLQLTYGAKHMGMEYERPHIGMKMSDAQFL